MGTRYRQFVACAVSFATILLIAPAAKAQFQPGLQPGQKVINIAPVQTTAEYLGMSGGLMKCNIDGVQVFVQFDPQKSKVKVTGTATPDFLAPHMYVQFKGTFNRYGKGTEPIKDVVIFTPDANNPTGAYELGGGNAFDQPKATKKRGPLPATTEYSIAGVITAVHRNTISVNCGNLKVKAELAPDATVKLDSSDPSWASQGDKVKLRYAKIGANRAIGLNVTIMLSKTLEGKKKHVPHVVAEKSEEKEKTAEKSTDKNTDKNAEKTADKTADKTAKPADKADKTTDKAGADKNADAKSADAKKPADNADTGK